MEWIWSVATIGIFFLPTALAVLCLNMAKEKRRNTAGWFFLGFFFGMVALPVLFYLEKGKKKRESGNWEK